MRIAFSNDSRVPSRFAGKRLIAAGIACVAILVTGCASHSSVSGVQSHKADQLGRCPLGQSKVCTVGWPSRLGGGDRDKTCHCS